MEVELIKANDSFDGSARRRIERLRVAAYCRVSTDDEDQIKSYNSMVTHYTELIQNNKEWIFSGIYADKAITGTKIDKRDEFQRLIQDCMDGKIDMVIAKSLPRFARNTLDTLKYVRMLKERNIAVYFEVEKINTLKDGEFLMTILSSVAQQEVENTSAYVKKGLKMKMKRGELVGFQGCLGYDYDVETKTISINEEGAVLVRYIFDRYVAGAGSTMIARELNEQGHLTIRGNSWTSSSVMGIINNEKYKGDILLGKTFTVDPISKRRLDNLGEEDRYYIHNHHEPIITEEQFERAQEMRNRRNGNRKHNVAPGKREKFSRQFAFSCMIECGFCGSNLSRRSWHSNSKYKKTMWQCVKSTKEGKRFCPDSKGIPEQVIEDAFIESYRMLCNDNKDVLEEFLKRTEKALGENSIEDQLHKLQKNMEKVSSKRKKLLDNYLKGIIEQDIYEETDVELKTELTNVRAKLEYLQQQSDEKNSLQRRISDFKKALSHNEVLEEFDRGIFESIVEKVIVGGLDEDGNKDPYKITFIYKTGFKNEIGNAKGRFGKSSGIGDKVKKMCSDISDEIKRVCSDISVNTCAHERETAHCHHHHEHRGVKEIAHIIEHSAMTDTAKKIALRIFEILAKAESKAHDVPVEQVHFHEVGAVDSIVDIVSVAVCLDNLDITDVVVPVLYEGCGTVRCQHGILPIPVPAVANVISENHLCIKVTAVEGELVTPTGAAIVAAIRTKDKLPEEFEIKKIGIGAGKRQYECPGILRAMIIS